MNPTSQSNNSIPNSSDELVSFTIEDAQRFKYFSNQLLYISESLKNIIQKYL